MKDQLLTVVLLCALFALGAVAALAPRSLLRWHYLPRALGLTDGARAAVTRAAGAAFVLVSLWLLWRLFGTAA